MAEQKPGTLKPRSRDSGKNPLGMAETCSACYWVVLPFSAPGRIPGSEPEQILAKGGVPVK